MEFEIKKLNPENIEEAYALMRAWYRDEVNEIVRFPDKAHVQNLIQDNDFLIFVAEAEGEIVGGLTAYELTMFYKEEKEIFLYEIGISSTHRRKGIAGALIEALKEYCVLKGIKTIFVLCEVDNDAARKLYENTGGKLKIVSYYEYDII
jgi:aminoglycoside 3-N-acetyltransferase I